MRQRVLDRRPARLHTRIMATTVSEPEQTDDQLAAAAARRGNSDLGLRAAQEAFEQLYRRHAPLLLAFIAARVGPADREDLHQEVWRRAWLAR
jgi:hypothetical protein